MTMIIGETGWYVEYTDNEGRSGYKCVGTDKDDIIDYLDNEGYLSDVLVEWVKDNYDIDDIIEGIINDCPYCDRDSTIDDYRDSEVADATTIEFDGGDEAYWFEEGEELDDAEVIVDSDGEAHVCDEEDEDEDEEEEED